MTDNPFLQQVVENPDDDAARLVYADYLEEQGDPRCELIRLQCELTYGKLPRARQVELLRELMPLLRAHAGVYGKLALIHFDAHTDTYNDEEKYNHGCMFYRAPRDGLIDPAHSIQVGIRTEYDAPTHEFAVLDAQRVNDQSAAATVAAIRSRVGSQPAYLSFDIDCLDPACAPGTGTPVVGGLSTSRALQILQGIADLDIVGFDVMEVAPAYDHADITALAGATLALQFLYMRASRLGSACASPP